MTTLFACFDKYCYELPVEPLLSLTSVQGTPSATGFDESRSAKRKPGAGKLASTLGECTIGGVPPGKRQNEEKKCSVPRQNKMMRNTYSCSVLSSSLQRRSYEAFDSHSRSCEPSRAIAMLGFLPGRRRDWSDLVRPRWGRRHFSAAKKSTKITE